MSRKQITLSDIAQACGTSNVTVSKALAGKSGMSDELRERIIATAEKLGYVPQKSSTGGIIAVLIPEKFLNPNGSLYWALYNNISLRLKQDNYACIQEILSVDDEKKFSMPAFLSSKNISGVISLGQLSRAYLEKLTEKVKNIVLLDYYFNDIDIDCIITNGYLGGYKLTSYLISQGHKDIGYVGTTLATSSIFDRYMGYLKAMIEHDLPIKEEWHIDDRDMNNDRYKKIAFPENMPTAFVCNCDETAFDVIRDLKTLGYNVPDDISVVGYDNYHISEISEPPITTINVDVKEMADTAVNTLLDRIKNNKLPTKIQLIDGNPIYKGSVKPI